jgi:hypothetical protein
MDSRGAASSSTAADEEMDEEGPHGSMNPTEFLKMQPKKSILKIKQASFDDLSQALHAHGPRDLRGQSEEMQKAHFDEVS